MGGDGWRRYAAPAGFLLAVTVAVVLVRSGLEAGRDNARPSASRSAARPPATTTVSHRRRTPTKRFWTVKAGDTFGSIAAATGVSVAQLQALNPKVSSTALFIGEKVRLR